MRTALLSLLLGCAAEATAPAADGTAPAADEAAPVAVETPAAPDLFETWLDAPFPVSDGFAAPVDRSWRDCGDGCWRHTTPSQVRAPSAAEVVEVAPDRLVLASTWYEDDERRELRATLSGLASTVTLGATVARGDPLGTAAHLFLSLEGTDEPVAEFLAARPSLPVPQEEPVLALVSHDAYELRIFEHGAETGRYAVSFGQEKGEKHRRGDNRTPKGMYFVVAKSEGPFTGATGPWYGGHWIKVNYPNAWDAVRGVDEGLITTDQQRAITRAWRRRALTAQNTRLGGGIGFHGWAYEWSDRGPRHLSWGCIVVHMHDVDEIYAALGEGAMVILI